MKSQKYENREKREARKSANVLFVEAMEELDLSCKYWFNCFEKSAQKGHKESQFILDVMKKLDDGITDLTIIEEAFAATNCPQGWYWAGRMFYMNIRLDDKMGYFKKSSDAGYSWGQQMYAECLSNFNCNHYSILDYAYINLLEKASSQGNTTAMLSLAMYYQHMYYQHMKDIDSIKYCFKVKQYMLTASELGSITAKSQLAKMYYYGVIFDTNPVLAARYSTKKYNYLIFEMLNVTNLINDTNHSLIMELGRWLYWQSDLEIISTLSEDDKKIVDRCADYYCCKTEATQTAIFQFLYFWNKTTGIKDVGKMIGQMAWDCFLYNVVIENNQNFS